MCNLQCANIEKLIYPSIPHIVLVVWMGEDKEEGWVYFTTRLDSRGRLAVPPDDRENMGVYKKAAQVEVKMRVLQIYPEGEG